MDIDRLCLRLNLLCVNINLCKFILNDGTSGYRVKSSTKLNPKSVEDAYMRCVQANPCRFDESKHRFGVCTCHRVDLGSMIVDVILAI